MRVYCPGLQMSKLVCLSESSDLPLQNHGNLVLDLIVITISWMRQVPLLGSKWSNHRVRGLALSRHCVMLTPGVNLVFPKRVQKPSSA